MPKKNTKVDRKNPKGKLTPKPRIFRKGEKIVVLCGKEKGKYGSIVSFTKKGGAIVEGINKTIHHIKDRGDPNAPTGRIAKENPIHVSNISIACPHCARPVRPRTKVEVSMEDGVRKVKKTRFCHRCGGVLATKK
jgi:large subunit ribosomal protein L24